MRAVAPDLEAIGALVQDVAHRVVLPRFRDLAAGEIAEKSPGDLVTAVDLEAERVITAGLRELAPGVPVVGEEAVAADPSLLALLGREGLTFVVDPIDGTRAFVEGDPDFSVMVALVDSGVPVASWIALPAYGELFAAEQGSGAFVSRGDGPSERIVLDGGLDAADSHVTGADVAGAVVPGAVVPGADATDPRQAAPRADLTDPRQAAPRAAHAAGAVPATAPLRGGVANAYLPDGLREEIGARVDRLAPDVRGSARLWAGATYRRVLLGEDEFIVYWRTNPWDHAPGAVLVREAGGLVQRWDGTDYRADDTLTSLLIAATPEVARKARSTILGL